MRRLGQVLAVLAVLAASAGFLHAGADPAHKCSASKIKAVSKKISAQLKCISKAVSKQTAVDPACLSKADTKYTSAITKAESKPGCAFTGDGANFERLVNNDSNAIRSLAEPNALVCCAYPVGTACNYAPDPNVCTGGGGTPGAAGTACDGVTGTCVSPPAIPGNCCHIAAFVGNNCLSGAYWSHGTCEGFGGVFDPNGLCPPDGKDCVAFR